MAGAERKRAELVAAHIERDIVAMGWPVGKVIGSEAALVQKYGVSRAVFREAVRLIEHHMVGRMRPGPGGGLVVGEPDPEAVARAMSVYLSFAKVRGSQLLEIRSSIEGFAGELAAQRATDEERLQLRQLVENEVERAAASPWAAKEFHLKVAEMAHNPAIYLFVRCLVDLAEERTIPEDERHEAAVRMNRVHAKIAEAIISGDSALARYRMGKHVNAIGPWLSEPVGGDADDETRAAKLG
jgi:DNA-binding FadR family transcriptional regulator